MKHGRYYCSSKEQSACWWWWDDDDDWEKCKVSRAASCALSMRPYNCFQLWEVRASPLTAVLGAFRLCPKAAPYGATVYDTWELAPPSEVYWGLQNKYELPVKNSTEWATKIRSLSLNMGGSCRSDNKKAMNATYHYLARREGEKTEIQVNGSTKLFNKQLHHWIL